MPKNRPSLKVAIVHDWLYGGGAERVVEQLHKLYPDAPIYTSYCSPEWRKKLDNKVITGYLQHWPFSKLRKFLPVLRSRWFSQLDLNEYDLVISSSGNGEAKNINVPKTTKHICYCHSPTHFYWRSYKQYLKNPGFGIFNPLARLGLKLLVGPLKKRDYQSAQKPDIFIANSSFIASEIKMYYGRDAVVINPPVNTDRFSLVKSGKRSGFITVGRQVPYKQTALIIKACDELNLKLKVIGNGPEHANLTKIAGPTIEFVTGASDSDVAKLLASAEGFIFAAIEDFGIAPVEALACGTPIIALKNGGALDYVKPGVNGEFFNEQSVSSLVSALKKFNSSKYDPKKIKATAAYFSEGNFRSKIQELVNKATSQ